MRHSALLIALLLTALAGVLFFGLKPKNYDFSNNVKSIETQPGLRFGKYGIAYTKIFDTGLTRQLESLQGFTVLVNFQPKPDFKDGFGLMLVLHDGDDDEQLIIGQWQSHIIAMNGDDYAHKTKLPRISFDADKISNSDLRPSGLALILASDNQGTRVHVNGKLVKEKAKTFLRVPHGKGTRLILGNSPYGKASWQGDLYHLAFYAGTFSEEDLALMSIGDPAKTRAKNPGRADALIAYDFKEIEKGRVADTSHSGIDLQIPPRLKPIKKNVLAWPWQDVKVDKGFFLDVALNLIGFIPLGFLLSLFLLRLSSLPAKQALWLPVLACFLISLGIEIAQAWLPSRSSSMLDVVMNTAGSMTGAMVSFTHFVRYR